MENEDKILIPLERFEDLISIETRAILLESITQEEKYGIEREKIATILGFRLKKHASDLPFPEAPNAK